jgi:hypothetical protein
MNKIDNTINTAWNFTAEVFYLPKPAHALTTIKLLKISTSKQLFIKYKLCFTVEQALIHETAGLLLAGHSVPRASIGFGINLQSPISDRR